LSLPRIVTVGGSTKLKRRKEVSILGSDKGAPMVARSGKGKVVDRGYKYRKLFVYIPKDVANDTAFPFEVGEDVTVTIDNDRLIIQKRSREKPILPHLSN